jgi:hypothetical protein
MVNSPIKDKLIKQDSKEEIIKSSNIEEENKNELDE